MGWDEEGMPSVLLREGTNDWTCLADWPASPGNDPQCFDTVWAAWNEAFMAGEDPELDGPGVGYMLAGGSDPSNTDPFAMEPAAGEEWVSTPPHMMILAPGGFDAESLRNRTQAGRTLHHVGRHALRASHGPGCAHDQRGDGRRR